MRVLAADRRPLRAAARHTRALNIELLGLAAASIIVLFGIALTYAGQDRLRRSSRRRTRRSRCHALKAPADLEPALTMFESAYERQFVARALFERATSPRLRSIASARSAR